MTAPTTTSRSAPPTSVSTRLRVLAHLALVTSIGFVGCVLAAGFLDPGYSHRSETVSALASVESHAGVAMTVGFALLAASMLAAGYVLWSVLRGKAGRTASALIVSAGLATVAIAGARQSCSTLQHSCQLRERAGTVSGAHVVHDLVALTLFTLLVAAGLLLAAALRRDHRFQAWARLTQVGATASLVLMVWFGSGAYGADGGLVQRALILAAYGLPLLLALLVTGVVPATMRSMR